MVAARGGRFEEIDVLRGVAALSVVAFHYSGHCTRYFSNFPFTFEYGRYGVQLFFVVSGFVIYFTLTRSRTWLDFAFARFSRLYPVYWVTLTIVTLASVAIFGNDMWWGGYVANMTMLQSFIGFPDTDIVFWSLAVELAFYLVMGTLFVSGLLPRIVPVAMAWLGLSVLATVIARSAEVPVPAVLLKYLILDHVPYFIAGIMFYLINIQGLKLSRNAVIIACLATEWYLHGTEGGIIALVLFGVFALAIMGKLKFMISPVTLWLGAISYPLYLVHRNTGYEVLFKLDAAGLPSIVSFVVALAGAILAASTLTIAIERPTLKRLRAWYSQRSPST